jgi:hypothetical protein
MPRLAASSGKRQRRELVTVRFRWRSAYVGIIALILLDLAAALAGHQHALAASKPEVPGIEARRSRQ